jgi:peptide/nickel transport system substrate-binding protein
LVQYREDGSDVESGLATSWAVSRDGLIWTFKLRQGVRFHDGSPLTAPLVVKSFARQMGGDYPSALWPRVFRGVPGVIKEIEAPDLQTVRFHLVIPYAPLLTVLAHPALAITLPAGPELTRFYGTGPFRVVEMSPARIVLEVYGSYWGTLARLDRIVVLPVADDASAKADIDAQKLDLAFPVDPPASSDWTVSAPGWTMGYLAIQIEREPFSKKKVRQAIAAAMNPALLAGRIGSVAIPSQGFLPLGVWGRWEGPPVLGGDPSQAKRLLTEAGYPQGVSGTLLVESAPSNPDKALVAEAVRTSLSAAGIAISVRSEPPDIYQELAQRGEYDLLLREMRTDGGDPHLFLYPISSSEGAVKGPNVVNFSFYRNPRLDGLLIRASQLSFRPERLRLYQRAQSMLADEVPWVPLYVPLHWAWVRPEVRGFRLHPSGIHRLDKVWIESAHGRSP